MFKQIIMLFWDLCLFRKGPQDVPHHLNLLALFLCLDVVLEFAYLAIIDNASFIVHFMVRIALLLFLSWLVLLIAKKTDRWLQTVTAIIGVDVLLNVVSFISQRMWMFSSAELNSGVLSTLFMFLLISIAIWQWFINANIFRQALHVSYALGVFIALLIMILSNTVLLMQFLANIGA